MPTRTNAQFRSQPTDIVTHNERPVRNPESLIRMPIVGSCFGNCSERRLMRRGSAAPHRGPAFLAYAAKYLMDADNAIIVLPVDHPATRAISNMKKRLSFDMCMETVLSPTVIPEDAPQPGNFGIRKHRQRDQQRLGLHPTRWLISTARNAGFAPHSAVRMPVG
jgi:hypothetical protein